MDKLFNLLIINETPLIELFSREEFTSLFNVRYVDSVTEILKILELEEIPDTIILGEKTALASGGVIFTQIKEQIVLRNALNDSVGLTNPVIVLQNDSNDIETQELFYKCGAFDSYPININPTRLASKIRHLSEHFHEEQKRITSSSVQQRNTIKNLVQIHKKTGVYNKSTFINKTKELLKNNPDTKYVLTVLNFDRFKVFNDMFGFDSGDKVLEKIGSYMNKIFTEKSIVGHIYADHFVFCTPESYLTPEILDYHSENFVKKLHPNFDFIVRFGIYKIKSVNEDISLACDRAELALNTIKQSFTDRYVYYDDSMIQNLKQEQELITDMVAGIQNREFKVYLQPQYDYTTESLVGAEALVRWQHPKKGLISPALFIPVFERNGFITQLDEYVWEEACRLMREWIDKGLNPVPVSVNISRRDIYTLDLKSIFDSLLKKYNLTSRNLRLEITESSYMDNPEQLIQVVEDLRKQGFCMEMDDFGSGYSSLNTLKEVPVDILKLDMKFIAAGTSKSDNPEEDAKGGSILSSVVRMANWLHIPVIAEGIESKEQADYLKSIGCFHMQGYYFAKPMPSDQYETLLTELPPANLDAIDSNEINEAAKFLDASTQATLIFNSFVGGAAIIEWTGENIEVLRLNDQYLEEIGTSMDAYASAMKNFVASIDENSRSVFMTTLSTVTRSSKPAFCEVLLKPVNDMDLPFWVRIHLRHLGKTITSNIYYMSVENIDFRMQLLQLNTNLSEQLSNIMETVPCGIVNMNYSSNRFNISYINETAARLLGYTVNDFRNYVEDNPFIICHPEDRHDVMRKITDSINTGEKTFNDRIRIICKDGSVMKVQCAGTVLKQSDGTVLTSIVFVNISDQEEKLIKNYEEIFFSLFNEVFEIDFEKNTSRTVKADYISDANHPVRQLDTTLEKWIELSVEDSEKEAVRSFFSQKNIEKRFKQGEKVPSLEFNSKSKDGSIKRLCTSIIRIPMEKNTYLLCNKILSSN